MILENWKMSYDTYKDLACIAPCSMYSVLFEHGIIEDPFYGINEIECMTLSEKGCVFESLFEADEEMLKKEYIELNFLGLDTICKITLNGVHIANVKNMHRKYTYDVKDIIVSGENIIRLEFSSPTEYFKMMNSKHRIYTNLDSIPGSAHLRKAFYMSGWDWGPKLPDMGIFRPVYIDAYDTDKIESVFVRQHHSENEVTLEFEIETKHNANTDIFVCIDNKEIKLDKNKKGTVVIKNPKLWWIRGYGEQSLYEVETRMENDGICIDKKIQKTGLRTLTVSTEPDENGREFAIVINGIKIFAMGANYIPQDNLLSRISPQRTEKLIQIAVDANFNCMRVWGGGYYPEDEFYELCDEYGLVVWQDFMVACNNMWLRKEMREECIEEATYNLKRLRHHASFGIFCGNNEMELAVHSWDIDKGQLVREDYIELYERILPELADEYAPEVFYWPASPSSGGGFDNPNDEMRGDVHFWEVWHNGAPFTEYRKHKFRFCSEYGFQSYPSMKTIRSFCEEKDMNCFSRVMENHQKHSGGNKLILSYLADNYKYPVNFETLVYASQLLQADAIKYGVEHFRRSRGICMGSIYWQFNDCWPVTSWSSVDYFGRYKALHYAAKKFYSPVAMGLFVEKDVLSINISNETMSDFEGGIKVYECDSKLNVKNMYEKKVGVDLLTSDDVFKVKLNTQDKYKEFVYAELFDKDGNFIMQQTVLFVPPKHFEWEKPNLEIDMKDCDGGVDISIKSEVFTKGVYVDFDNFDCKLSDNFFDLTNTNAYIVKAKTDVSAKELKKSLRVFTVFDIGR